MRLALLLALLAAAGCAAPVISVAPTPPPVQTPRQAGITAARNFITVVEAVEPQAERECRARTRGVNCDFIIVVDDRRELPPNAFQTLDKSGRPIVGFTLSLIAEARNADELAFILGHEAAHHIAGHIGRTRDSAMRGAIFAGVLATVGGANAETVREAQNFGASLGARRYSKGFELEADALGTLIAARAGFDPLRGAEYFTRTPDPGNRFLGTHPPNAQRIATVRRVMAGL
ncbi:M48 family metallopeptidase [Oceaniovalibus sp. ACAM 378]|uniref:M48 family metallopeptidase n=1 Tax=Oceaniovalibus sp. ACAM 378 TaxID=2599923 RepID=UPI0011D5A438|nr:M48 family metallopeptidase [Oceaniovalibus sp. ACAM 378]TYB89229.1 M48 family metalloprotease [Oceaniovalibus sp. ACAM 378]